MITPETGYLYNAPTEIPCCNCQKKSEHTLRSLKTSKEFICKCGSILKLELIDGWIHITKVNKIGEN